MSHPFPPSLCVTLRLTGFKQEDGASCFPSAVLPGGRRVAGGAGCGNGSDWFRAAEGDARRPLCPGESVSQRRTVIGQASGSQSGRHFGEDLPKASHLPARGSVRQTLTCGDLLLFFVLYDIKWNIFWI